jgi:hypothetical protein
MKTDKTTLRWLPRGGANPLFTPVRATALAAPWLSSARTSDHECTIPGTPFPKKPGCDVVAGNAFEPGCRDTYGLCFFTAGVAMGYDCTETYTQTLKLDDCQVQVVKIHFRTMRTAAGCTGTVTRE